MNNKLETIAIITFFIIAALYIVACGVQTLENLDILGASMLFTPSFSVRRFIPTDRRYSESDPNRKFAGLHTPAYRVLNHVSKTLLDSGLYGVCNVVNSRGQFKSIGYKSLFNVTINHGYSSVSIGARTIFAVDEWAREIYHIDASGRLAVTPFHQGYDMTDVITQVSEAIEVLKDCYTSDKLEAIDLAARANDWVLDDTDNLGTVKPCKRETVKCWFIRHSSKSVNWAKQWRRTTPSGSTEWKITTGSHPSAYQVVIGSTTYWLPHSILSRQWEVHGGRTLSSDHGVSYFQFNGVVDTIDLPVWWLEKNVGLEWRQNIEPIDRTEFFKTYINKRRRR